MNCSSPYGTHNMYKTPELYFKETSLRNSNLREATTTNRAGSKQGKIPLETVPKVRTALQTKL